MHCKHNRRREAAAAEIFLNSLLGLFYCRLAAQEVPHSWLFFSIREKRRAIQCPAAAQRHRCRKNAHRHSSRQVIIMHLSLSLCVVVVVVDSIAFASLNAPWPATAVYTSVMT